MHEVLKLSREGRLSQAKRVSSPSGRGTALSTAGPSTPPEPKSSSTTLFEHIQELEKEVACCEEEIKDLDATIRKATEARQAAQRSLDERKNELDALKLAARQGSTSITSRSASALPQNAWRTDYSKDFEWTVVMKAKMKKVFGIDEFRLCQAGSVGYVI